MTASDNERKVLYILAQTDEAVTPQELADSIKDKKFNLSYPIVKTALHRLNKKKIIIQPDKFVYAIPDKMFGEYVLRRGEYNEIQK